MWKYRKEIELSVRCVDSLLASSLFMSCFTAIELLHSISLSHVTISRPDGLRVPADAAVLTGLLLHVIIFQDDI